MRMIMSLLNFKPSVPGTMGLELELQIINKKTYNLDNNSQFILDLIPQNQVKWVLKPEITKNNLEINTSVHTSIKDLYHELIEIRDALTRYLSPTPLVVSGGGVH